MLLSAATETEIRITVIHNGFVRTGHLTSTVSSMLTVVVVKSAHDLSILCSLSLISIDRDLSVTVAEDCLATDLSTGLLVSCIPCHHHVCTTTPSPRRGASPAGSSRGHMEGLARQVVGGVLVITCHEEVLGKTAIAVEHGKARRVSSFGELRFQTSDLEKEVRKQNNLKNVN